MNMTITIIFREIFISSNEFKTCIADWVSSEISQIQKYVKIASKESLNDGLPQTSWNIAEIGKQFLNNSKQKIRGKNKNKAKNKKGMRSLDSDVLSFLDVSERYLFVLFKDIFYCAVNAKQYYF